MTAVAGHVAVSGILLIGLPKFETQKSKLENRKSKLENRRRPHSRSWNRFSIVLAETQNYVIPAKAGIQQVDSSFPDGWEVDSRLRGNDFGRKRHHNPSEPNFEFRLSQFDARIIT
jgi:hypothetical protein